MYLITQTIAIYICSVYVNAGNQLYLEYQIIMGTVAIISCKFAF